MLVFCVFQKYFPLTAKSSMFIALLQCHFKMGIWCNYYHTQPSFYSFTERISGLYAYSNVKDAR